MNEEQNVDTQNQEVPAPTTEPVSETNVPAEVVSEVSPEDVSAEVPADVPEDVPAEVVPDLEVERDLRVVPVAKGVLEDIVESMPTSDLSPTSNFTPLLISILKRSLAADLNLTTDNPYIFQLVLGAFSAFSTVVQKCNVQEIDDARFARISQEMLKLLASTDVPMGKSVTAEDQVKVLEAIQPQLEELFSRETLTWLEVKYILQGIFQSLKLTEQAFSGNVQRSVEDMEAKILGIETMSDLSMQKLDETLKASFAEVEKSA